MQPSVEWVLSIPFYSELINLFYSQVQSAVIVNGHLSPCLSLSRGVKQGCPLSPLSYVLVAEVLAVNIRCNPRIPGLSLPGVPLVVSPAHYYFHFIHV